MSHVKNSPLSAIFIDRDGVINREVGYCHRIEDFSILDGVIDFLKYANTVADYVIIVTNQAGIAKGIFNEEDYHKLTKYMLDVLHDAGVYIDEVIFCPHHPDGINAYRMNCSCRKPHSGMIDYAVEKYSLERSRSIMIGDKLSDINAGINASLYKKFLVSTGHSLTDECIRYSDGVFDSLSDLKEYLHNVIDEV
ncbi:MAG: D-glycero-alpha-D-manno-heptose-1,7-bisphosphate 7-phosphatase [Shewanella sp.]